MSFKKTGDATPTGKPFTVPKEDPEKKSQPVPKDPPKK